MEIELKDRRPPEAAALRAVLDFNFHSGWGQPFHLRHKMPVAFSRPDAPPEQRKSSFETQASPAPQDEDAAARCINSHKAATSSRSVVNAPIDSRTIQRPSIMAGVK